jgi:hypothetical protein
MVSDTTTGRRGLSIPIGRSLASHPDGAPPLKKGRIGWNPPAEIPEVYRPTTTLTAVTGYGQEEERLKAREAGFDHHMVKPGRSRRIGPFARTNRHGSSRKVAGILNVESAAMIRICLIAQDHAWLRLREDPIQPVTSSSQAWGVT